MNGSKRLGCYNYEAWVASKLCPETPGGGMVELDIPSLISIEKPCPIYLGFRPTECTDE